MKRKRWAVISFWPKATIKGVLSMLPTCQPPLCSWQQMWNTQSHHWLQAGGHRNNRNTSTQDLQGNNPQRLLAPPCVQTTGSWDLMVTMGDCMHTWGLPGSHGTDYNTRVKSKGQWGIHAQILYWTTKSLSAHQAKLQTFSISREVMLASLSTEDTSMYVLREAQLNRLQIPFENSQGPRPATNSWDRTFTIHSENQSPNWCFFLK